LEGDVGDVVAGFVEPAHGFKEGFVLLFGWSEFNHQSLQHDT